MGTYYRNGYLLYRKYREFFLPTILAGVASSMSIIVDSMLVGNMLGPVEMAGVNLCMPVMQFYFMISVLIGMGASTLISINLGKRDVKSADAYFNLSGMLLVIISLVLTIGGFFLLDECTWMLTSDPDLYPYVKSYLIPLLLGNFPILMAPAFSYILRTDGFVRLASVMLIVANLLNLLFDVVYMGPMKLGILGSSLATVTGFFMGMLCLAFYVFSKKRGLSFNLGLNILRQGLVKIREILITGTPAAIGIGLVAVKLFFINHLVGNIAGSDGLVVFSVCLSCLSFISLFISGTAGTMMPIVGTLLGERDFRGIHFVMRYALTICLLVSGLVIVLFECFPAFIFSLFGIGNNSPILALGITGLRLFSISLFGVAVSFLMMYYFLTIRKSLYANIISFTEGLLFPVPLAWALSLVWGLNGVWFAYSLTEVFAFSVIFLMIRYARRKEKNQKLNILLMEDIAPEVMFEASVNLKGQEGDAMSGELLQKMASFYPDNAEAPQVSELLQELADVIQKAEQKKKNIWIDIRVLKSDDGLKVILRNDGTVFNPIEKLSGRYPDLKERISYTSVLSLNQIQIEINK